MKTPGILERLTRDQRGQKPDAINLMAREGRAEDLPSCYALHHAALRLRYDEPCWRVLPELWRALLRDGAIQLFLVENRAGAPGSRIVSFSATVFVTDKFCSEARSTLPPYLGLQMVRRYLSHDLPILSQKQVAQTNARAGLNVLVCFEGLKYGGFTREEILAAREKHDEAFRLAHSGYHVKEFLAEPIGEVALQWMLDAGASLRRDYSKHFRKVGLPTPDSSQHPWLVGLTNDEACARCGSHVSSLFAHSAPRFHFSRSEQSLLRYALMGKTCEELASMLSVSPWTVKKRWHAIYDRVADVDGELLQPPVAHAARVISRGVERRRHLLYYLRQHPEELRPFREDCRLCARPKNHRNEEAG